MCECVCVGFGWVCGLVVFRLIVVVIWLHSRGGVYCRGASTRVGWTLRRLLRSLPFSALSSSCPSPAPPLPQSKKSKKEVYLGEKKPRVSHTNIYIHVYIHIHTYTYIHIHTYMYIHTHKHTHTRTHHQSHLTPTLCPRMHPEAPGQQALQVRRGPDSFYRWVLGLSATLEVCVYHVVCAYLSIFDVSIYLSV